MLDSDVYKKIVYIGGAVEKNLGSKSWFWSRIMGSGGFPQIIGVYGPPGRSPLSHPP